MAALTIEPHTLSGSLTIPPSKSHTMRALLFASMAKGTSHIHNYLPSPDTTAMIHALRSLGATVDISDRTLTIEGVDGTLQSPEDVIDAGNSGQVLRFIGSLAALGSGPTMITGDASVQSNRPVAPLLSALTQLGAFATSSCKTPLLVRGPLRPGTATLPGEDSQPVSGLLMAAAFLNGTTKLHVTNPGEKPWIDLTLSWLNRMGARVSHQNHEYYSITGPLHYRGFNYTVPGDFSSAAFPLAAALVTGSTLTLENLNMNDAQGDKQLIPILQRMGASIEIQPDALHIKPSTLVGTTIDANPIIDAVPILAVLGCCAQTPTTITNAAIARRKESDRLAAITTELRKMGAQIEEQPSGLTITPSSLHGAHVHSHKDHRIAMALAVAGLAASTPTTIENPECIAKSYPTFTSDLQQRRHSHG